MVVVKEIENNFFGLVLNSESANNIDFKSDRMVTITMASLDTSGQSDEFVPVVLKLSEDSTFVVCTLSKERSILQQQLQLVLNPGENVKFSLGAKKGSVSLTGYYVNEEMFDDHEHGEDCGEECGAPSAKGGAFLDGAEDDDDEDDDDEDDDDEEGDEDDDELDSDDLAELVDDGEDDGEEEDDEDDDDDDGDDDEDDEDDDDDDEEDEEEENNGKRKANGAAASKNQVTTKKLKDEDKPPQLVKTKETKPAAAGESKPKTIQGGVIIQDLKDGNGPEAKKGKFIHVYYTGRLKSNGKQFDACQAGKPFKFRLGSGEVIKGWDVGFEGMKVGGKRLITVPPNMGYGNKRMGPDLPANSTLIFAVELKAIS